MSYIIIDEATANYIANKCNIQTTFEMTKDGKCLCIHQSDMEQRFKKPKKNVNVLGRWSEIVTDHAREKLVFKFPVDLKDLHKVLNRSKGSKSKLWGAEKMLKTLQSEPNTAYVVIDHVTANAYADENKLEYCFGITNKSQSEDKKKLSGDASHGEEDKPDGGDNDDDKPKGDDNDDKAKGDDNDDKSKGGDDEPKGDDTDENNSNVLSVQSSGEETVYYFGPTPGITIFGENAEIIEVAAESPTPERNVDLKIKMMVKVDNLVKLFE